MSWATHRLNITLHFLLGKNHKDSLFFLLEDIFLLWLFSLHFCATYTQTHSHIKVTLLSHLFKSFCDTALNKRGDYFILWHPQYKEMLTSFEGDEIVVAIITQTWRKDSDDRARQRCALSSEIAVGELTTAQGLWIKAKSIAECACHHWLLLGDLLPPPAPALPWCFVAAGWRPAHSGSDSLSLRGY